ncbi:MAG: membrane protein insertase YidC [Spirochaetaceae bacterium]|jgi:YidC/Oxa1 family membrane protein insertase|nr:membrane protein insertase YidC [Spirochaetaceae bacterium]
MIVLNILYNLIIFPIEQIIEVSFMMFNRIFHTGAASLIGVSLAVSICTLPLYFVADAWQKIELAVQKKLKPGIDKINAAFKGDERYMMLSTFYRQNHYHPVYAMRGTAGLLIQIPFFIAAYHYLSHLPALQGASFLFLHNLGRADGLVTINGLSINIMPVIMTAINCVSGVIYTKGFPAKNKIQIFAMALIFLVLLYHSPSGLVLYWTLNNIFSLFKNILQKTKNAKKIIYSLIVVLIAMFWLYFIPKGLSPKRLCVLLLFSLLLFIPLIKQFLAFVQNQLKKHIQIQETAPACKKTFFLSAIILFLLSGLVIPGLLISSSVVEFSFIENYTSPLPFIFNAGLEAAGIFFFWLPCIYLLFSKKIRYYLSFFVSLALVITLADIFIFPGDFGFLTSTFRFSKSDTLESQYTLIIISTLCYIPLTAFFSFLLLSRRKTLFHAFQMVLVISLTLLSAYNLIRIQKDFTALALIKKTQGEIAEKPAPVYTLSQTGKNVIVVMLDRAISAYLPYIFNEKPELSDEFKGFTYYPNCVSFGSHTRIGAPALFGSYEYEPALIQKDRSFTLKKHNEALLVLPRLFSENNYQVTVTDPSFANYSLTPDLSIYDPYPKIHAENINGKYSRLWLKEYPEIKIISISDLLNNLLIRFSIFKMAPTLFRVFIYDKGEWLSAQKGYSAQENTLPVETVDNWTSLYFLPDITKITRENENTYTAIVNDLTHNPAFFNAPDYTPSDIVTNKGPGPFADEEHYHVNIAAYIQLGKWLRYLQDNNVYDNSRIIIASDHGIEVQSQFPHNITLPNGDKLSAYNSVLLVKDFNEEGSLKNDTQFMTQADVPLIALDGLIKNPKNPWTGQALESRKENGVTITSVSVLKFSIEPDEWLTVHDDIFKPENWRMVKR